MFLTGELVGDESMKGSEILQHFIENHGDVPCDEVWQSTWSFQYLCTQSASTDPLSWFETFSNNTEFHKIETLKINGYKECLGCENIQDG
jgi:hypothetical protein